MWLGHRRKRNEHLLRERNSVDSHHRNVTRNIESKIFGRTHHANRGEIIQRNHGRGTISLIKNLPTHLTGLNHIRTTIHDFNLTIGKLLNDLLKESRATTHPLPGRPGCQKRKTPMSQIVQSRRRNLETSSEIWDHGIDRRFLRPGHGQRHHRKSRLPQAFQKNAMLIQITHKGHHTIDIPVGKVLK